MLLKFYGLRLMKSAFDRFLPVALIALKPAVDIVQLK